MTLMQIIGAAVLGLAAAALLHGIKSEIAVPFAAFLDLTLLGAAIGILMPVIEYLGEIGSSIGDGSVLTLLFKAVGCGVITGIAASLCRDCRENSLAEKVELCGRCVILSLSLPLIRSLFGTVFSVLPQ